MSIIGTRPPLISETNLYELHHGGADESPVFGIRAGCVSGFEIHAVRLYIFWGKGGIQVDILA